MPHGKLVGMDVEARKPFLNNGNLFSLDQQSRRSQSGI
jgi:hypothetical protein